MTDISAITPAMQDYLETMLSLSESVNEIRVTDIAAKLSIAKATVTQGIEYLKKHGLVLQEKYGPVELTASGKAMAVEVRWRHRKLKQFLTEVLSVDAKIAEKDACLMEHVVSKHTMNRLMHFLESTDCMNCAKNVSQKHTPATNNLSQMQSNKETNPMETKPIRALNELKVGERGRVIRIASDKALKSRVLDMGVTPGAEIKMEGHAPMGDPVEVDVKGYHLTLRKDEAAQIYVEVGA
ncbi:MAG: metal-dependent transcriptional regulator [Dehalococcoides mccartyi]|uniref:metal-dependent transcriptional regulator n=1 Tax=Dehalococcoides TaxID=61434 RepID=UPI002737DA27|nr:metal-dependent transcriptional regulator [Dehalococcoides mccartyi]MDP4279368.1 metal-dependent transcriptional regulator [Dehalococcoides mccartyi]